MLRAITQLTLEIKALDEQIEKTAEERYPETRLLTQVPGVGVLTAQCFMLTLEDPARFPKPRAVASYVGLRPRQADSGSLSPQLRITKAGDEHLLLDAGHRRAAHPGAPGLRFRPSALGTGFGGEGAENGKKRAVVAVARKLAVLLLRLWQTGEIYEPLKNAKRRERISCLHLKTLPRATTTSGKGA